MNKMQVKKGFTLLEILVATVIFVIVMSIAAAVIAQGSSYSGKIKRLREASESARQLADMITRDIKSAQTQLNIESWYLMNTTGNDDCSGSGTEGGVATFNSGLAIIAWRTEADGFGEDFYCIDPEYTNDGYAGDSLFLGNGHGNFDARMLVIGKKDKTRVYVTAKDAATGRFILFMKDFDNPATLDSSTLPAIVTDTRNIISNTNYSTTVGFGGFAPLTTAPSGTAITSGEQPIIKFNVTVQSRYFNLDGHKGEQAVIQSMVTSRNYDI